MREAHIMKKITESEALDKVVREQHANEMLGNAAGNDSEMSAIALYLYGHFVGEGPPELPGVFHKIALDEMRHLGLFEEEAKRLGADPRLWVRVGGRKRYWTAKCVRYADKPRRIVMNALIAEHLTIDRYTGQLRRIKDPKTVMLLEKVLAEEKEHVKLLTGLLKQL
jgi:bacterioferritin